MMTVIVIRFMRILGSRQPHLKKQAEETQPAESVKIPGLF